MPPVNHNLQPSSIAPRITRLPRKARADEVSVIEAAYRLDGTETEWLAGLAEAAAPLLDDGWGIAAATAAVERQAVRVRDVVALGGPTGFVEAAIESTRNARSDSCFAVLLTPDVTVQS